MQPVKLTSNLSFLGNSPSPSGVLRFQAWATMPSLLCFFMNKTLACRKLETVCAYMCVHRQRLMFRIFFNSPPPLYFQTGSLSLNLRLVIQAGWPVSSRHPLASPITSVLEQHTVVPGILNGCWRSELRSSCLRSMHFTLCTISPGL